MILSRGAERTECRAKVSSTTPKLAPRCPPFFSTVETMICRISPASCSKLRRSSCLRSSGELMRAKSPSPILLPLFAFHREARQPHPDLLQGIEYASRHQEDGGGFGDGHSLAQGLTTHRHRGDQGHHQCIGHRFLEPRRRAPQLQQDGHTQSSAEGTHHITHQIIAEGGNAVRVAHQQDGMPGASYPVGSHGMKGRLLARGGGNAQNVKNYTYKNNKK